MTSGVNFQPGSQDPYGTNTQRQSGGQPSGVQEAIKVLSLRLPKVLGARAVSPQALLSSPGSGGNPRVDSVVNTVLSRMFPTGAPPSAPSAPMVPGPNTMGGMETYRQAPTRFPRVTPGERAPVPVRQDPAIDTAPNPYPFPRAPEPPPMDVPSSPSPDIEAMFRAIQGTFGGGSYDRDPYAF